MIVYAEREQIVDTREMLASIRAQLADAQTALVRFGQLAAAVADTVQPEFDSDHPLARAFQDVTNALADALLSGRGALSVGPWQGSARSGASRDELTGDSACPTKCTAPDNVFDALLARRDLPERVRVRAPEGFAYYALYPEQYVRAVESFLDETDPRSCCVIGIRSIGATLAAVVTAALEQRGVSSSTFTVRPHGHPFDRVVRLSDEFSRKIAASDADYFLIVDEGPGLSGSSFASVCRKLHDLGIAASRVVLFPSHDADPDAMISADARRVWHSHKRYVADFDRNWISGLPEDAAELSGGQWRSHVIGDECHWPAAQSQHERRKFLAGRELYRFAGIGPFAKQKLDRASVLFDAGYAPKPLRTANGFLVSEFVDGRPLNRGDLSTTLLTRMTEYLAFLACEFGSSAAPADLQEMIAVNSREALGCEIDAPAPGDGQVVAIDGRMQPHEWIVTGKGFVKTDALDHHDDHFFPGPHDIVWDVAGVITEWALDESARESLVNGYRRLTGDHSIVSRLPYFETAYLCFRLGYSHVAAQSAPDEADRSRFQELERQYARSLRFRAASQLHPAA